MCSTEPKIQASEANHGRQRQKHSQAQNKPKQSKTEKQKQNQAKQSKITAQKQNPGTKHGHQVITAPVHHKPHGPIYQELE